MNKNTNSSNLTIDSLTSLFKLVKEVHVRSPKQFRSIKLAVPSLNEDQNSNWESVIRKQYFSCGCSEGALLSLLAISGYWLWVYFTGSEITITKGIINSLLVFLVMGIIGKNIGKRIANSRLKKALAKLQTDILAHDPEARQKWPPTELIAFPPHRGCTHHHHKTAKL